MFVHPCLIMSFFSQLYLSCLRSFDCILANRSGEGAEKLDRRGSGEEVEKPKRSRAERGRRSLTRAKRTGARFCRGGLILPTIIPPTPNSVDPLRSTAHHPHYDGVAAHHPQHHVQASHPTYHKTRKSQNSCIRYPN